MPTADDLAALMRKWPLNSTALVAATHGRFGNVADGTSIRVATCMINKLMAKINGKEVYNIRGPPRMGDRKKRLKKDGCYSYHPRKLL